MYRDEIRALIENSPLEIDTEIQLNGRPPTMANSEFLTNKEQGDWAEQVVFRAINENLEDYVAVKYGRSDSIAAGDPRFAEFYREYQEELNTIGKKPDLLVFKKSDFIGEEIDIDNDEHIKKAVAALEVRSSSFLVEKYNQYMMTRQEEAISRCDIIRERILTEPYRSLLERKNKNIFNMLKDATTDNRVRLDIWVLCLTVDAWRANPEFMFPVAITT